MCNPKLVTPLKIRAHYSQSSRVNATPSSGTSPLASYKEVTPAPQNNKNKTKQKTIDTDATSVRTGVRDEELMLHAKKVPPTGKYQASHT